MRNRMFSSEDPEIFQKQLTREVEDILDDVDEAVLVTRKGDTVDFVGMSLRSPEGDDEKARARSILNLLRSVVAGAEESFRELGL